ncbi:SAM-dependent methyltransferase [Nocardia flavorosea]|uniref:SAM-dependent methyltransferase n=1 Tax=Nocardia flavorosea TaxID=53429 RepID=A0A846Y973_9NOCA|nr:SAM-dependent methyltransferase [Nocardia flavorosea]NKY55015.1 SAM-dependent methyltransferase [Nocardia flavorosea]
MSDEHRRGIRTDIPHPARIWNYWMGGSDHYEVDRIAADAGSAVYPGITTLATESREFLVRAVRYLAAEKGIRQFLDIGTGLPTMQNTHEVAQRVAPESRIVYVDNDPVVLAHARTLLTSTTDEGVATYIDTDYRHPEIVVADARHILDLTRPVAVMFLGVLGHVHSAAERRRIVHTVLESTTGGSYLALWDGTDDDDDYVRLCAEYADIGGEPYVPRPQSEIRALFDGLEPVEPGFTAVNRWYPGKPVAGDDRPIPAYGGVARKP